jgi:hypothetical protein
MPSFITRKGLTILSGMPRNPGGKALNNNFSYVGDQLESLSSQLETVGTRSLTAGGGLLLSRVTKSEAYALTDQDYQVWGDTSLSGFTLTLPDARVVGDGKTYVIKNIGFNVLTVATTSSQTIDGSTTFDLTTQYESIVLTCDGSNWGII